MNALVTESEVLPRVARSGADAIVESIIRTVAYADVFDFAPDDDEVHRYLIGVQASRSEVRAGLRRARMDGRVAIRHGHVTLPWRAELVAIRKARDPASARLMSRALRFARAVGSLPFVRMVAISGALAARNAVEGDDIDLFVVTTPERLWLARAGSIAVVRLVALRGDELCPNYVISEDALELDDRDLYAATELAHLVPVVGRPLYARLRSANAWTRDLLPNADAPPNDIIDRQPLLPGLRGIAESMLGTRLGSVLEGWEGGRKVARFRARARASDDAWLDSAFGPDRCKGHFLSHRARIRRAYEHRSRAAGVEPVW